MFNLVSDYKPTGDQPKAIEYLSKGIEEGKKSLAYSLTFGTNDRTLTDEEINKVLEKIIERLSKIGTVRDR